MGITSPRAAFDSADESSVTFEDAHKAVTITIIASPADIAPPDPGLIRRIAYALWKSRDGDGIEGTPEGDWLKAEAMLKSGI